MTKSEQDEQKFLEKYPQLKNRIAYGRYDNQRIEFIDLSNNWFKLHDRTMRRRRTINNRKKKEWKTCTKTSTQQLRALTNCTKIRKSK